MDELVDIVDEADKIVATVTKKEAHEKGLLHRCVVSEVIDSDGNWTLVKQASDRQDAGQFVSPVGGHITAGETEDHALVREAAEEMGIAATKFTRVGVAVYNREVLGRKENHLFVLYQIYTDHTPTLNHEAVEFKKFSPDELKNQLRETPQQFGDAFWFILNNFYPLLCV